MSETYDKLNHWYGWNGGTIPVHPEAVVECVFDDGRLELCVTAKRANDYCWGPVSTIIAFRIIKLHVEPREFWIVGTLAYQCKRSAITEFPGTTAIHVREVEQPQ